MTLRSRLTLAFFAIAVIPLSAVTLFSYWSSERALKRAAEQQAATMAAELGHRMEWVTTDLERRMDHVWPMPDERVAQTQGQPQQQPRTARTAPGRGPAAKLVPAAPASPAPPPPPDMAGHLAVVLGDAAPMIESLEIMPGRGGWPGGAPARTNRTAPPAKTPAVPGTPSSPPAPPSGPSQPPPT